MKSLTHLKAPFILSCLLLSFSLVAGCGKKSKTSVDFRPAGTPLSFKCSRQADGLWTVSGGIVTQVGIISIEQTFDMRDEFTYLVFRDRAKGTDQVFKLATKGYVELHTVGEHKIRVQREENKVLIDVETLSGSFDLNVYPDSEAVARIEFGNGQPDFVFFTDKRLAVEYQSVIWSDDSLPLGAIQSVTFEKGLNARTLVFNWKPNVEVRPQPFQVVLTDIQTAEKNFLALQNAFAEYAPDVKFEQRSSSRGVVSAFILALISLPGTLLLIKWVWIGYRAFNEVSFMDTWRGVRDNEKNKGCAGCLLLPVSVSLLCVSLHFLWLDLDFVKSVLLP